MVDSFTPSHGCHCAIAISRPPSLTSINSPLGLFPPWVIHRHHPALTPEPELQKIFTDSPNPSLTSSFSPQLPRVPPNPHAGKQEKLVAFQIRNGRPPARRGMASSPRQRKIPRSMACPGQPSSDAMERCGSLPTGGISAVPWGGWER